MASRSTAAASPGASALRAYARIAALAGLFLLYLPPHLVEKTLRPGRSRWPQRFLARVAWIVGARPTTVGTPLAPHSLGLANHSSWLDILILAGATGTAFVSKAEIGKVPLIGWLADQNHTLYIERAARGEAHRQVEAIADALAHPRPLTIFPEGTTGDGRALLPFRPTLLEAVAPPPAGTEVRPIAIDFHEAIDEIAWHSGEPGKANALRILARRGTFAVTVRLLDPLPPFEDRKQAARAAQAAIAGALSSVRPGEAL